MEAENGKPTIDNILQQSVQETMPCFFAYLAPCFLPRQHQHQLFARRAQPEPPPLRFVPPCQHQCLAQSPQPKRALYRPAEPGKHSHPTRLLRRASPYPSPTPNPNPPRHVRAPARVFPVFPVFPVFRAFRAFRAFRVFRAFRAFRVFRAFRAFRAERAERATDDVIGRAAKPTAASP